MNWIKTLLIVIPALYLLGGAIFYFFQERIIFLPEPLDQSFAYEFDANFDELRLEMEDGAVLNALHFKPNQPKGIIVYFHGNAGNLSRWGEVVLPFVDRGYEVLLVDYRSYGKSTGVLGKKKMLKDAEAVYGYAANIWPQEQIIVYGRSLGSSFACHLAKNFTPQQVILESPFASLADVAKEIAWMYPVSIILKYNFQNAKKGDQISAPVTIIHGTEDAIVLFASGEKLHKALKSSEFYSIAKGGHNDLSMFDTYWEIIDAKLK